MLNNLENIHTFVLSLLSVPVLLIIFRIDNWYKTEGADHGGVSQPQTDGVSILFSSYHKSIF